MPVTLGLTTGGVDAVLEMGGAIGGRVRSGEGPDDGIEGVLVEVYRYTSESDWDGVAQPIQKPKATIVSEGCPRATTESASRIPTANGYASTTTTHLTYTTETTSP